MAYALDISRLGISASDYTGEGFTDDGYYQEDAYTKQNYNVEGFQDDFYGYASWRLNYTVVLVMFCNMKYLAYFALLFDKFGSRVVID